MVLSSLLQMNSWNPGAGRSLMSCVFSVSRAVTYSLETAAHKFSPSQLIQVGSHSVPSSSAAADLFYVWSKCL